MFCKNAAKEIKEAAKVILYQLDMRFPQMQVLSTFMLFSVTFNRAQVKKEVVDTKLRILSDHLAYDLATCQSEFDDLMDEVTVAKSKGMATDMDLWGHLLPRLDSRDVQMRLVEAVHLFLLCPVPERKFGKECLTQAATREPVTRRLVARRCRCTASCAT